MKPSIYSFLLLAVLFTTNLSAQLTIYGGPQVTSAQYSIRDFSQETEHKLGFMGGVGLKSLIEGPAYFSPMLFFSRKGYKVSFDRPGFPPDSAAANNNTTINTIELAPLVQFDFSKSASYAFFRFGPSFDFNLSGTETFDSLANNNSRTQKMLFDFGRYSHATISVNGHLGYQHKSGFTLFAFANIGLSSLNNADRGPKIFHRVGGVALGWKLGKKR